MTKIKDFGRKEELHYFVIKINKIRKNNLNKLNNIHFT